MARAAPYPLARERNSILVLLLVLATAAWVYLLKSAAVAEGQMAGLTMGLTFPLFLAIWVVMMVAMMFPTAAPMILTFARVNASRRGKGHAFVPTWIFAAAYLLMWTLFGILAYTAALGAQALLARSNWLMEHAAGVTGCVIVLTGIYQLSPLKRVCLSKCRSPLDFLLSSWRDGYVGSFRMGLEHGVYCLGCCWLLFILLFPLGLMNIAAMALITAIIFGEKSMPFGRRIDQPVAMAMIAIGGLIILIPTLLPASTGGM